MTYHHTKSGHIELLSSGGHGRPFNLLAWSKRPATIITDDGDGHYEAWSYSGKQNDAAQKLAAFMIENKSDHVVKISGNTLIVENTPEGFWIDCETGTSFDSDCHDEATPNLAAFPDILAW